MCAARKVDCTVSSQSSHRPICRPPTPEDQRVRCAQTYNVKFKHQGQCDHRGRHHYITYGMHSLSQRSARTDRWTDVGRIPGHVDNVNGRWNHLSQVQPTRRPYNNRLCRPTRTGTEPRSCASVAGHTALSNSAGQCLRTVFLRANSSRSLASCVVLLKSSDRNFVIGSPVTNRTPLLAVLRSTGVISRLLQDTPLQHEQLAHKSDPQAAPNVVLCHIQERSVRALLRVSLLP